MKKAPGKSYREGISLEKLFQMFPDDATAEKWFVEQRWPDGAHCPHCGSVNVTRAKHKTMPYLCRERECRKRFSVRIGTPMECSKLGYKIWVIAIFCQSAFNGDPLSSSNCDPPPGGGTGGEAPPLGQPAGTIHPNPFYADHPWLPFLRCLMRRSCYSQSAGSN